MTSKVIIVTGSATGIGRAIARRLAEEGASLFLVDKDQAGLVAVAEELGEQTAFHVADLTEVEAPERIVSSVAARFNRIDGIVNNAAYIPRTNIETTSIEVFDRAIAVNVRAPLLLIKAALSHLSASRGSVLNIGSINANSGEPNLLAYSISKGALQTLTRNLGDSLHREYGIRVNQINPGWVLTDNEVRYMIEAGLPADWPKRLPKEVNPSGSLIAPETIAESAIFWLSDVSRPISGSVVDMEQFPLMGRNPEKRAEE